jgi:outer membrane protein
MGWIYRIEGVFSSISDKILPVKLIRHEVKRGRSFTWWQSPETACRSRQTGRLYRSQLLVFKHRPDFQIARPFLMRVTRTVKASFWVVAALLLPTHAFGETLLEVYQLASQNDPKFRSIKAEARASGMAVEVARAGFLPTIRYDHEENRTRQQILSSKNPIFGAGVMTFPTFSGTLSVTQPIFRMDVIERFAQAKSVVKQAEYTVLAAEQDLQLRTIAAYLIVLAATDSLALATAEREAVGKLLDVAREKRKAGLGTVTQLYDATARFAVTQAREIEAQNKLRDAHQGLREITGRMIQNVQSLRDDFPLETPSPTAIEPWLESAMDRNLILRARTEAVEVARLEVERQRAGHYPSLNLLVSRNQKDAGSTLFGGGSNVVTTDTILRLTVPIYEGGMTSAVTEEAAHRYQKAQEDAELERRVVERAARAAFDGALNGVNLVQALKQSVVAQASALEAKTEGYKAGLNTLLPVLDAQRDLYLARRDYAQSRYEYLINRLKLKQAAGTLSETDLVGISSALR